jgi:hypothetical protein
MKAITAIMNARKYLPAISAEIIAITVTTRKMGARINIYLSLFTRTVNVD